MKTRGHVMVRVSPWEFKTSGGIIVKPSERERLYGEALSDVDSIQSYVFYEHYIGEPKPSMFRGHDDIAARRKKPSYNCSAFDGSEKIYLSSQKVDIKKGDTVYFSRQALGDPFRTNEDGSEDHLIRYDVVLARKRNGELRTLNSGVLLSPVSPEGFEEVDFEGGTIYAKFLKGTDIIIEHGKKPRYLLGRVSCVGNFVEGTEVDINVGDKVIFKPGSNYIFDIDGEEYYHIRSFMIYGKLDVADGKEVVKPLGDYISIEDQHEDVSSILHAGDRVKNACVTLIGEKVNDLQVDDRVIYAEKKRQELKEWGQTFIKEGDVYAKIEE
jgi:co-chaperonin GroES (HSP10)